MNVIMQILVVFCSLIVVGFGQLSSGALETKNETCITNLDSYNAVFGGAKQSLMDLLTTYANVHITRSFDYLLMASHFGSYQQERRGFQKLHRELSDNAWQDAIDLIKYITLRGGKMDFHYDEINDLKANISEFSELLSLATAFDIQKDLAEKVYKIYKGIHHHDTEMAAYLKDKFMHKHAKLVRQLSGYTHDLLHLTKTQCASFEIYVFDHFLQKSFYKSI